MFRVQRHNVIAKSPTRTAAARAVCGGLVGPVGAGKRFPSKLTLPGTAILLALLVALAPACAATDDALHVVTYGAPGADVYVTPLGVAGGSESGGGQLNLGVFSPRYHRGKAPLETKVQPGQYLVSVMPTQGWNMRDGMLAVGEYSWDGFDYHGLVFQDRTNRWRYAHAYLIDKKKGEGLTVFAVFAKLDQAVVLQAYKPVLTTAPVYTGSDDDAYKQLEDGLVPSDREDDILDALHQGSKVILRTGDRTFVISVAQPTKIRVQRANTIHNWAGKHLDICIGD